jgi:hypothetical protein
LKRLKTSAFVCLSCRKVTKRQTLLIDGARATKIPPPVSCPTCKSRLVEVGDAFRAPRKGDDAGWLKVAGDFRLGRRFEEGENAYAGTTRSKKASPRREKGVVSAFQAPARKREKGSR